MRKTDLKQRKSLDNFEIRNSQQEIIAPSVADRALHTQISADSI